MKRSFTASKSILKGPKFAAADSYYRTGTRLALAKRRPNDADLKQNFVPKDLRQFGATLGEHFAVDQVAEVKERRLVIGGEYIVSVQTRQTPICRAK